MHLLTLLTRLSPTDDHVNTYVLKHVRTHTHTHMRTNYTHVNSRL